MKKALFKRDHLKEVVFRANNLAKEFLKAKEAGSKMGRNVTSLSLKSFVELLRRLGYFRVTHTLLDKPGGQLLDTEYSYAPPSEEKFRFRVERFTTNRHYYYYFGYKENGSWVEILETDSPARLLVKMAQIILRQEGRNDEILQYNPEDFE